MFCSKCGKETLDDRPICADCEKKQSEETFDLQEQNSGYQYIDPDSVQKTNSIAVASLIVSIIGLFTGLGLVGMILGIVANNQIKASSGSQKGSGIAIAGIVIGVVGIFTFFILILSAILFPVFNKARVKARDSSCLNNLKQIGMAAMMYSQDYDEILPPANSWCDAFEPYIKNKTIFMCPEAPNLDCGYSFYEKLNMAPLKKIVRPQDMPLVFDSPGGWNSAMPIEAVVVRHPEGYNCVFADGHAEVMPVKQSSP